MATAVFWDSDRREVGRLEQAWKIPGEISAASEIAMPAQLAFPLPPGFYYMAVTVAEPGSGRFSSHRKLFTC